MSVYMRACEGTRLSEHHLRGLLLHRDDTQVIFASVRKKGKSIGNAAAATSCWALRETARAPARD